MGYVHRKSWTGLQAKEEKQTCWANKASRKRGWRVCGKEDGHAGPSVGLFHTQAVLLGLVFIGLGLA